MDRSRRVSISGQLQLIWRSRFACLLALAMYLGCSPSSREGWLRWSGLHRAPAPPPLIVDVIVDASVDAPGSPATLRETLGVLAPVLVDRGGVLRVWGLGESAATSRCYVTLLVTRDDPTVPPNLRTQAGRALQAYFSGPPPRRSPLVDVIATVALETSPPGDRVIVLISDLAEMSSHGRFEVSTPTPALFVAALRRDGVLPPRSLAGVRVVCSYSRLGVHTASPQKVLALRDVFRAALIAGGAERVVFSTGPLQPNDLRKE